MHTDMCKDLERVLLDQTVICTRITQLAQEITSDYQDKDLTLVCILNGAVIFFADLARALDLSVTMDFMAVSSYGKSIKSSGLPQITKDLSQSITDRHVLIAEDIIDSGVTLNHLKKVLHAREPASLRIVTLLDKPDRRECDIQPDYCGFRIPNEFVVGYGLDYAGKYRNLPFIGVLKPEIYGQ